MSITDCDDMSGGYYWFTASYADPVEICKMCQNAIPAGDPCEACCQRVDMICDGSIWLEDKIDNMAEEERWWLF